MANGAPDQKEEDKEVVSPEKPINTSRTVLDTAAIGFEDMARNRAHLAPPELKGIAKAGPMVAATILTVASNVSAAEDRGSAHSIAEGMVDTAQDAAVRWGVEKTATSVASALGVPVVGPIVAASEIVADVADIVRPHTDAWRERLRHKRTKDFPGSSETIPEKLLAVPGQIADGRAVVHEVVASAGGKVVEFSAVTVGASLTQADQLDDQIGAFWTQPADQELPVKKSGVSKRQRTLVTDPEVGIPPQPEKIIPDESMPAVVIHRYPLRHLDETVKLPDIEPFQPSHDTSVAFGLAATGGVVTVAASKTFANGVTIGADVSSKSIGIGVSKSLTSTEAAVGAAGAVVVYLAIETWDLVNINKRFPFPHYQELSAQEKEQRLTRLLQDNRLSREQLTAAEKLQLFEQIRKDDQATHKRLVEIPASRAKKDAQWQGAPFLANVSRLLRSTGLTDVVIESDLKKREEEALRNREAAHQTISRTLEGVIERARKKAQADAEALVDAQKQAKARAEAIATIKRKVDEVAAAKRKADEAAAKKEADRIEKVKQAKAQKIALKPTVLSPPVESLKRPRKMLTALDKQLIDRHLASDASLNRKRRMIGSAVDEGIMAIGPETVVRETLRGLGVDGIEGTMRSTIGAVVDHLPEVQGKGLKRIGSVGGMVFGGVAGTVGGAVAGGAGGLALGLALQSAGAVALGSVMMLNPISLAVLGTLAIAAPLLLGVKYGGIAGGVGGAHAGEFAGRHAAAAVANVPMADVRNAFHAAASRWMGIKANGRARRKNQVQPVPRAKARRKVKAPTKLPVVLAVPDDLSPVLTQRVRLLGCRIQDNAGNGDCQFDAIADQLERCGIHHTAEELRAMAARHIRANLDRYEEYIEGNLPSDEYLRRIEIFAWGDELSLRALSRELQVNIVVISDLAADQVFPMDHFIMMRQEEAQHTLYLGHYAEMHYVSLVRNRLRNPYVNQLTDTLAHTAIDDLDALEILRVGIAPESAAPPQYAVAFLRTRFKDDSKDEDYVP